MLSLYWQSIDERGIGEEEEAILRGSFPENKAYVDVTLLSISIQTMYLRCVCNGKHLQCKMLSDSRLLAPLHILRGVAFLRIDGPSRSDCRFLF
jgi:hypothetical protein